MRNLATLEIVTPTPTYFFHCPHCETALEAVGLGRIVHNQEINEYPEELKAEYLRLCNWVREAAARCGGRLRVRTYPFFVLDGQRIAADRDLSCVDPILREWLGVAVSLPATAAPRRSQEDNDV